MKLKKKERSDASNPMFSNGMSQCALPVDVKHYSHQLAMRIDSFPLLCTVGIPAFIRSVNNPARLWGRKGPSVNALISED